MGAAPLFPSIRLFQNSFVVLPSGVKAPKPVTTTLRCSICIVLIGETNLIIILKIIPNGIFLYSPMKTTSKSARTRAFIIEKTAAIFNKKGFAGTSISDLTAATGLTKGALYGNFESKEAIAVAAFEYNIASVRNSLHAKATPDQTTIEKLLTIPAFCREHFKALAAQGGCALLNTAVEADDNQPLLKKKVNSTITRWEKNIEATIQQGIEHKEIKPKIDPSKYAAIIIALFEGGILLSKSTGELHYIHHCADKIEEIIQHELRRNAD